MSHISNDFNISGPVSGERPILLNAEQVAALMGIHRATVYELIASGQLTSLKIGRRRLVSRGAIDQFIADRESQVQS